MFKKLLNNNKFIKATSAVFLAAAFFAVYSGAAHAAISNPVLNETLGGSVGDSSKADSGALFVSYFITLWNALISVGAIALIGMMLWGAIDWIVSGGDKGKLEGARNKMTQAAIGLVILVSSFVIINFISDLFFGVNSGFNILQPKIPTPNGASSGGWTPGVAPATTGHPDFQNGSAVPAAPTVTSPATNYLNSNR